MTPKHVFDEVGYVVLKDVFDRQRCQELTDHMFTLFKEGKLEKDEQCPLSDSVYGDPVFDSILEQMAEPIGNHIGKVLLPTYTYARIYRPGEELKIHKDRPACQYSATLTLGFDAKQIWPIFMDEKKETRVDLDVGEMIVYSGCDIAHWRPPFKGNWQVQVFFHYVEKGGPFESEFRDGRSQLGVDKNLKPVKLTGNNRLDVEYRYPIRNGIMIPSNDVTFPGYLPITSETMPELMFTKEECKKIIGLTDGYYSGSASIGTDGSNLNRDIRSADIFSLDNDEENRWIFDKVANIVAISNAGHFDYDIMGITHSLQLIHYNVNDKVNGHYNWHIDAGPGEAATRKISFTAQLSDPDDYTGCNLNLNDGGNIVTASREQGSIHLFPSYLPHQVTSIESGDRWALVIWVHGSKRFR